MAIGNLSQYRRNVRAGRSVRYKNTTGRRSVRGSLNARGSASMQGMYDRAKAVAMRSSTAPTRANAIAGGANAIAGDASSVSHPPQGNTFSEGASPSSFGGDVQPATARESFGMSRVGEYIAGLSQGFSLSPDFAGRDLLTLPIAQRSGVLAGIVGHVAVGYVGGLSSALSLKTTAVSESLQVGKLSKDALNVISAADMVAVNTASVAKTASWLGKAAKAGASTNAVVGALIAAIGSYPFAGFIKEEALQTVGFATSSAVSNNDFSGVEEAFDFQEKILDPNMWSQIKAGIPFVNVLDKLNSFYKAARLKLDIDKQVVSDLKIKLETGESDADMWSRINDDRAAAENASIDYYNSERKKLLLWEEDASDRDMVEDAAFWRLERERVAAREKKEREDEAKFWLDYKKESMRLDAEARAAADKAYEESRPSKLGFGII